MRQQLRRGRGRGMGRGGGGGSPLADQVRLVARAAHLLADRGHVPAVSAAARASDSSVDRRERRTHRRSKSSSQDAPVDAAGSGGGRAEAVLPRVHRQPAGLERDARRRAAGRARNRVRSSERRRASQQLHPSRGRRSPLRVHVVPHELDALADQRVHRRRLDLGRRRGAVVVRVACERARVSGGGGGRRERKRTPAEVVDYNVQYMRLSRKCGWRWGCHGHERRHDGKAGGENDARRHRDASETSQLSSSSV